MLTTSHYILTHGKYTFYRSIAVPTPISLITHYNLFICLFVYLLMSMLYIYILYHCYNLMFEHHFLSIKKLHLSRCLSGICKVFRDLSWFCQCFVWYFGTCHGFVGEKLCFCKVCQVFVWLLFGFCLAFVSDSCQGFQFL